MNGRRRVSINLILLAISLAMTLVMASGFYLLIQEFFTANMSTIEKNIQANETQYWVHYIEKTYQYTLDNLISIQNDRDLVHDIQTYIQSTSIVNKVRQQDVIGSKLTAISQRFEGISGITLVMADGSQISGFEMMIASDNLADLLQKGQANQNSLFASTVGDGPGQPDLLASHDSFTYLTVNLFDGADYVASAFIFMKDNNFWGKLYQTTRIRIVDGNGSQILNTFTGESTVDEADRSFIELPNGWQLSIEASSSNLKTLNQTLILYLGVAILIFTLVSFGITLVWFRKPFSMIGEFKRFIEGYSPEQRKHERFPVHQDNIRRRLIQFYILSVILPSLVLFIACSFWYNGQIEGMIIEKYANMVNTSAGNVEKVIDRKRTVLKSLLYDYDFQTYIFDRDTFIAQHDAGYIREVFFKYAELGLQDCDITVFDNKYALIYASSSSGQPETSPMTGLSGDSANRLYRDEFGQVKLSMNMDFGDIYANRVQYRYHGRIDIPLSELYEYYSNLNSANSRIFVFDRSNAAGSAPADSAVTSLIDGSADSGVHKDDPADTTVFYTRIGGTPWYLTLIYDFGFLSREVRAYINSFISIFLIIILLSLILVYFLADVIRKPLARLGASLRKYNAFAENPYVQTASPIKEVADMTEQFNDLLDRIDELYDELIISANEKNQVLTRMHKAELTALQSQINPHFLTNTLDNLIALIYSDRKEKAVEMVNLICTQFRVGISRKTKTITLQEEIVYTRAYIEIIKIRFGDNITFNWIIDESLLSCQMIKLVLQPLVENAVRHGLVNRKSGGVVSITAERAGDNIAITVADNGEGIPEDQLQEIREQLRDSDRFEDHIGLTNVHWRLRLMYGDAYGVTLSSAIGEGTRVTLLLPCQAGSTSGEEQG